MATGMELVAMAVITGVVVGVVIGLVLKEQRCRKRQRPHAEYALAKLYGHKRDYMAALPARDGASRAYVGLMAAASSSSPSSLPGDVRLMVLIAFAAGVWAIATRRTALGVSLVIAALAVAGAAVLIEEAEGALQTDSFFLRH